jgi:hypothetical protein
VGVGTERLPVPEVRGDPDGIAHGGDPQLEAAHVGAPSSTGVTVMATYPNPSRIHPYPIDPPIVVAAYCLAEG